ncbi:SDR family NAD(P)-dependent oxidoreductase [Nocardia rhizosphaerae]|uniref:SDR family NAD(P)-dependent oxidoreductase n=1 Tax=Nocardia rhizosphaerae TaxID=1691571 RepID=A0ABV8LBM7_9NOCA
MSPTTDPATILLTGATSGLGLAVARLLAGSAQWTVITTARSAERAGELRELLGDPAGFRYVVCDQTDSHSIRAAAGEIRELLSAPTIPPLRSLVLNAGIQTGTTASATVDGYELTFATNLLGPHLLVGLLSDALTAPARLIAVGSGTHYGRFRRSYGMVPAPQWQDPATLARPRDGDGIRAYATSKLATLYWVHEIARRAPQSLDALTYDPGMMPGTGLARDRSAIERFGWKYLLPAMRVVPGVSTAKRSAQHLAALATGTDQLPPTELRGAYVEIDHIVESSAESYDRHRELELFQFLDDATGLAETPTAAWWSVPAPTN